MGGSGPSLERQQGFTLVEILVALMILSFVALGIAGLFSHSMIVNASGHDYAVLASEARFALESLQARPFVDAALAATSTPRTWAPVNRNFTINYTVDDFFVQNWAEVASGAWPVATAANPANLKRITMTVASTNEILMGQRVLTVSTLKIPG
ncbi:MAG: prepilin-type N-terminal cleavage/methylation domain-containing protein [Acidobacteria bacterium]|nr:prepilin-type N-terminal cleavage/methylation domain-containing protein [Candidatus Sulfomarinibacter sp. MAG AM2]